jgi:hypothetical protein
MLEIVAAEGEQGSTHDEVTAHVVQSGLVTADLGDDGTGVPVAGRKARECQRESDEGRRLPPDARARTLDRASASLTTAQQGPHTPAPLHELTQLPQVAGLQQVTPGSPQSASAVQPLPQNELPVTAKQL